MANINVLNILSKVFGPRGLPFPQTSLLGDHSVITSGFEISSESIPERSSTGTPIKKYTDQDLGQYNFLPVTINGIDIPNALIIISGEKSIIETDIVDVGTVFEKVFTRPYDITIICTLIGIGGQWPETEIRSIASLWKKDELVTLKCALTDIFIEDRNNMVITKIDILDADGSESVEVIQLSGRSNIDFELEII